MPEHTMSAWWSHAETEKRHAMPEDGDLWGTLYSAVRNAQQ